MSYVAPVNDMLFCMKELADLEAIACLPGFDEAGSHGTGGARGVRPLQRRGDGDAQPRGDTTSTGTTASSHEPGFKERCASLARRVQACSIPATPAGRLAKTIGAVASR